MNKKNRYVSIEYACLWIIYLITAYDVAGCKYVVMKNLVFDAEEYTAAVF